MRRLLSFALVVGVAALTIYAMVVGRALLLPLVVAIVVWYLLRLLAGTFRKLPFVAIPPWLAMTASIVSFLLLTLAMAKMIGGNLASIAATYPTYEARLDDLVAGWAKQLGFDHAPTVGELFGKLDVESIAGATASAVAELASNAGLVTIYVIFLLMEQGGFNRKLTSFFANPAREQETRQILQRIDRDMQTYLRIKVLLALATAIFGWVVMAVVGLEFATFWAALFFLFYFIPTIGTPIALLGPALFSLMQFETLTPFLIVVGSNLLVQIAVANLLEPALMGRSLNLSPLVNILALVVFGTLWGLVGMVLCVPILVAIMIVLAHFERTRGWAVLLSADGEVTSQRTD